MVVALRAEIENTLDVAKMRKEIINQTLQELDNAVKAGGIIADTKPLPPNSLNFTDAIVYRALAPEFGRLPDEIIRQTSKFYTNAREAEKIGLIGDFVSTLRGISENIPRVLMHGGIILSMFDRFLRADCSPTVNLKIPRDEYVALAKEAGYPLEKALNERGKKLSDIAL